VLSILAKGHTRADFFEAVRLCRAAGLTLIPTFVAFHPWLTLADYCDLLDTVETLDLIDHVAPIQLAIRLLIPEGSLMLTVDEMRRQIGAFDPVTLTYRWTHPILVSISCTGMLPRWSESGSTRIAAPSSKKSRLWPTIVPDISRDEPRHGRRALDRPSRT
jgi:hypothetical protein